jgi:hypothetical protein
VLVSAPVPVIEPEGDDDIEPLGVVPLAAAAN